MAGSAVRAGTVEVRERGTLDRATIVRTALKLLEEGGIDGLSTRRLAAELGIKSASLYWHFKDKSELLNEMSGVMFEEALPPPPADGPAFDWAEWLAEGARCIRRTALSRRDGAQVMARPRPKGPESRIPFEVNVKALMRSGLSARDCALTFQTLRRYAIGSALQEQSTPNASPDNDALVGEKGFEFGLQTFIAGLKLRAAAGEKVEKQPALKKKQGG